MKNTTQQIKIVILGLALAVGFSYAFAWSGPPGTPPNPNAAAPLNVGSITQGRLGALGIGTTTPTSGSMLDVYGVLLANNLGVTGTSYFDGTMQIANGTQGTGRVLESDSAGDATWVATSSLNIAASGGSSGVSKIVAGPGISISPSTGIGTVTISTTTVAATIPSGLVVGGCYTTFTDTSTGGTGWGKATYSGGSCTASAAICNVIYVNNDELVVSSHGGSGYTNQAWLCTTN